jgi:hypothetical protein
MEKAMTVDTNRSPAAKVMSEAIDLAIKGRSPFPESAAFIDAGAPSAGHDIKRAADEGLAVVLVSVDGSTRISTRSSRRTERRPAPAGSFERIPVLR